MPGCPIRELAIPRIFSDGSVINSASFIGAFSVDPSQNSRIKSASIVRRLGDGAFFSVTQRLDVIVEMID